MAISTIASPDALAPAYNPLWYVFDSTNKTEPSYRYVVDLYLKGAATYLHRYTISPRPGDGYCNFNCSKVLQTQFNLAQVPTFVDYEIKIGEEYSVPWAYTTVTEQTTGVWNGYIILTGGTHSFILQDQIDITQAATITSPEISGLHTVVEVISSTEIVIDVLYPGTTTNTGTVEFADGRRILFPDLVYIQDKRVFQGAIHHSEYNSYVSSKYTLATSPVGYAISYHPSDDGTGAVYKTTGWQDIVRLAFKDTYDKVWAQADDGTIYESAVNTTSTDLTYINMGPTEIAATCPTLISGSGALLKPGIKWYRVLLVNSTPAVISRTYQFNMLPECNNYETMVLMFKDRLGSIGSFTFRMRHDQTFSWDRKSNTKVFGSQTSTNPWTYASTEAGRTIYDVTQTRTYTVRTEWLTPADSDYFLEMMAQPEVYLIKDSVTAPVVIITNSLREGKRPQDKNIKYEIQFTLANNDIINI